MSPALTATLSVLWLACLWLVWRYGHATEIGLGFVCLLWALAILGAR